MFFIVKTWKKIKEQSFIISNDSNGLLFKEFGQRSGETRYCTEIGIIRNSDREKLRNKIKNRQKINNIRKTHLKASAMVCVWGIRLDMHWEDFDNDHRNKIYSALKRWENADWYQWLNIRLGLKPNISFENIPGEEEGNNCLVESTRKMEWRAWFVTKLWAASLFSTETHYRCVSCLISASIEIN